MVEPTPGDEGEELLFECLEALEQGGESALEELLAAHPEAAPRVRARLDTLRRSGLVGASSEGPPERLGDFLLRERLGEGGMGVVYRAEQVSLGREVALKLVRPDHLHFGGVRQRFQREVEVVAGLHHPGIVAVHAVGEEAGLPYFAMELVDGMSLEQLLERARGRGAAEPGGAELRGADIDPSGEGTGYLFAGTWQEACLRVVRQVCEALQFAHERGVLHRDIKPSNIMITGGAGSARALLLDFGLARTARLDGRKAAGLTRTGMQVGSPRYMAPEQIRGEVDSLGPTTDVYGLGITLYELLTVSPAFEGAPTQIAMAVERGELPPLRARAPQASWEVETIVAKATDVDPARRYASAADLARDLGNALEHRPIEARRASALLRARRWAQRHPARATATLLGLVFLTTVPTAYAWQQHRAAARISAERDAATRGFKSAMEAVDRMLSRVGGEGLAYLPAMERLRQELLEDAVALLERVVEEGDLYVGRDGTIELARARQRLGLLHGTLGQSAHSFVEYQRGLDVLEEHLASLPDDAEANELYVELTIESAGMSNEAGQHARALDLHTGLAEWLDRLDPALSPDALASARARNRVERAHTLALGGRVDEARALFEDACAELDSIAAEGGAFEDLVAAATGWSHYGSLHLRADPNRIEAAGLAALERALELFREVVALDPTPRNQATLCAAMNNASGANRRAGNRAEADALVEEARATLERLVAEHPSTLTFELELGAVLSQLGALRMGASRDWAAALPYFEAAARHSARLTESAPGEVLFQARRAIACYNVATAQAALGVAAPAREANLVAGLGAAAAAANLAPEVDSYPSDALGMAGMLADLLASRGDHGRLAETAQLLGALPARAASLEGAAELAARAVRSVNDDEELDREARTEAKARYAEIACSLIERGLEAGASWPDLRAHRPFSPLRGQPAFEELCAGRAPADH